LLFCAFAVLGLSNRTTAAVVNILQNGSFEDAGTGSGRQLASNPPNLWNYLNLGNTGEGWHGVNGVGDATQDQTPFGSRLIEFGNGSANPGNGLYQTFSASSGVTYFASISAKKFGATEPVAVTLEVRDASGIVVDTSWIASTSALDNAENGIWSEVSFVFTPLKTDTFQFRFFDSTPLGTSTNTDLFVDNAMLYVIPEPSSLSLITLGLFAAGCFRRKKN
jgi:hypothetical protein